MLPRAWGTRGMRAHAGRGQGRHLALLGAEESGGAHGWPKLGRDHHPALAAGPHALDPQLEACGYRVFKCQTLTLTKPSCGTCVPERQKQLASFLQHLVQHAGVTHLG